MASTSTKKTSSKQASTKKTSTKQASTRKAPSNGSSSTKQPSRAAKGSRKSSAARSAGSEKASSAGTPPDDINEVALEGRLATAADIRTFDSGVRLARLLVTVRSDVDRPRTDVVPVTVWNPAAELGQAVRGDRVTVSGTVQRRFWTDVDGRKSRVEVVASSVEVTRAEPDE